MRRTDELTLRRLKEERKCWLALKKAPEEIAPLFPVPIQQSTSEQQGQSETQPLQLPLPDISLLDESDAKILRTLFLDAKQQQVQPLSVSRRLATASSRLLAVQSRLEFSVDVLADGVHKLARRAETASREADVVLALSAERLREREARERTAAGTAALPAMEVLRGLGRLLPPSVTGTG